MPAMPAGLAPVLLAAALALPSGASATEFFATTDETRTSQDCLTEATACALGRALKLVPFSTPSGNPFGVHVLTLLSGTYDNTDVVAGDPTNTNISVGRGATLRGKPGAPRPTIALVDPGFSRPVIDVPHGGIVRDLIVDSAALIGIRAAGRDASVSGAGGDIPAIIERVTVVSKPRPGDTESFGITLDQLSRAVNVDVDHRAPEGAAAALGLDRQGGSASPRIVGSTLTSASGFALDATGGREGTIDGSTPPTLRAAVVNTGLRGNKDLFAKSDLFNTVVPANYIPNPIELTLTNTSIRSGAARVVEGPGVVTFVESGIVDTADVGLGADRVPTASSPLIDGGSADADLGIVDLLGNARTVGPRPDIGAYERQVAGPAGLVIGGSGAGLAPTAAPTSTGSSTPAPLLKISLLQLPKTVRRSVLRKGFLVRVNVSGPAVLVAELTGPKGKRLARTRISTRKAGNAALRLKAKVSGRTRVAATLKVTATPPSGNPASRSRKLTIR